MEVVIFTSENEQSKKLKAELDNYKIEYREVKILDNPLLAEKWNVHTLPNIVIANNDEPRLRLAGYSDNSAINVLKLLEMY